MGRNKRRRSLTRKEKRETELKSQPKVVVMKRKKTLVLFKPKRAPRYV